MGERLVRNEKAGGSSPLTSILVRDEMEKHYFYVPQINPGQKFASITGDEFYHLSKVLRLAQGNIVYLLNGKGLVIEGKILDKDKNSAVVEIISSFKKPP